MVEAPSIVSYLNGHLSVSLDDPNSCPVGARVLGRVAERLLYEPVDRTLDLGLEATGIPARLDIEIDFGHDRHVMRLERAFEEAPQRRLQSDVIEGRGAQLGDKALKLGYLGFELSDGLFGRISERCRTVLLEGGRKDHLNRAQPLERFVVKL